MSGNARAAVVGTDRRAVSCAGVSLTDAELSEQVDHWADVLAEHGVGPGERVAWSLHNRVEVVVLALAVRRLGALAVPLSYRLTAAELARMIPVVRPTVVVVEEATQSAFAGVTATRLTVRDITDTAPAARSRRASAERVNRLGAGGSVVFTSGTTGTPKAALRTSGDAALGDAIASRFGLDENTRYLVGGPLYHSGPLTCALMALARGGSVLMLPRFGAEEWLREAREHDVTAGFVTPTQLRRIVRTVERGHRPPGALRHVVVSGEPFPAELKFRAVEALGPCLLDCYGCTELGPMVAMSPEELLLRPMSSGRAFPGVELAAFDGDRMLPPGEVGTLRARTPLAFQGYLDPASGRPRGGGQDWGGVGDVGSVDEEGYVHLVDRSHDLIISGGVNVFPSDVESPLAEHPAIRDCAVVGLPDPDWGEIVCAAVVSDHELTLTEIREWLVGRVGDDKRPRRLERVAELPVTEIGKLSRRRLRDLLTREVAR